MALSDPALAKVFANNLAHFGRMLSQVDALGDQMISDIREGRQSVDLPEDAREFMQELLSPNPERADALDVVMREFGSISSKEAL